MENFNKVMSLKMICFLKNEFVLLLMIISSKKYQIQTLKTLKMYYGNF